MKVVGRDNVYTLADDDVKSLKAFVADRWPVLTSVRIQIEIDDPKADYEFKLGVPAGTGLDIASRYNGACDYESSRTSTMDWVAAGATEGTAIFYLVRCRLGSGGEYITVHSRLKNPHRYVNHDFERVLIPEAPHLHDKTAWYRICGSTPPNTAEVNYVTAISLGAAEWNTGNQTGGFRISKLRNESNCEEASDDVLNDANSDKAIVSVVYWNGKGIDGCNHRNVIGCNEPTYDDEKSSHRSHQTLSYRYPLPEMNTMWTDKTRMIGQMRPYLPALISHEFGHSGGLGHSHRRDHLMHQNPNIRSTSGVLNPQQHDKAAMKKLYENHMR